MAISASLVNGQRHSVNNDSGRLAVLKQLEKERIFRQKLMLSSLQSMGSCVEFYFHIRSNSFNDFVLQNREIEFPMIPDDSRNYMKYEKNSSKSLHYILPMTHCRKAVCSSYIPNPEHNAWEIISVQ